MSGDYISREAARPDAFCEGVSCQECPFCKDPVQGGCRIDDFVKSIPAADVVEVRHERWDLAKDPFGAGYVKCSRCGYKHCPEYYPDGSAIMHLFCPSCGSKMDGDGE